DGALYGTTQSGGSNGLGTVFKLNKDGSGYMVLHGFPSNDADGWYPVGALVQEDDGALYGTTERGGTEDAGTLFKLNTDGSGYSIIYDFGSTADDGLHPQGLATGSDGALYGTTYSGGSSNLGTVFRLNKDGTGYS